MTGRPPHQSLPSLSSSDPDRLPRSPPSELCVACADCVTLYSTGRSPTAPLPQSAFSGCWCCAEENKTESLPSRRFQVPGGSVSTHHYHTEPWVCGNKAGGGGEAVGRKRLGAGGGQGWGWGGQGHMPTYVTELPVPAVVTNALPGFHAESVNAAGKGHTLVAQGTLPARLAPAVGGGVWRRKMGTYEGGQGWRGRPGCSLWSQGPLGVFAQCQASGSQEANTRHLNGELKQRTRRRGPQEPRRALHFAAVACSGLTLQGVLPTPHF